MKLGELCTRLDVPYRHARYALEEGILPKDAAAGPGRGEHRDLDFAQAFWLGIVLKLKSSGVKTPMAGQIADYAREAVPTMARNLGWDYLFDPFGGKFDTDEQWYIDIGDLTYIRVATTANPSSQGLHEERWSYIAKRRAAPDAAPVVIIRVNINRLAAMLGG